jgi:hypothetical protein
MQEYKILEACDGSFGKRESLNKNFVPVETYPELKCKNRRMLKFDSG